MVEAIAPTTDATAPAATTDAPAMTDCFRLHFRNHLIPFHVPPYEEVSTLAFLHFEDPGMNVSEVRYRGELYYEIQTTKEIEKEGHSLEITSQGQTYTIPLIPAEPSSSYGKERRPGRTHNNNKEDNLLLTFQGAGDMYFKDIPNEKFDELMREVGLDVVKFTERQKKRGHQTFNRNRYCVVKKTPNTAVIPDSVPVKNQQIRVTYFGKKWFCGLCNEEHVGKCLKKARMYEAKEQRERMKEEGKIETKIVSDSTMRYLNPLGLKTDVLCMSGGGLGQIAQAVTDDPETVNNKNIVLVGGTNDMKTDVFSNDEHFANNISKSLDKVHALAIQHPDKNFILAKSQRKSDSLENDEVDEEEVIKKMVREDFLHWKIDTLVDQMEKDFADKANISSVELFYEMDDTSHPKKDNTQMILNALQDHSPPLPGDLIWEEEFTTAEFIYKEVQSIYRYGCNCCRRFGQGRKGSQHKNPLVCDDCMAEVTGTPSEEDQNALTNIRKYVTDAFKETVGKKRACDDDGEDNEEAKKTRLAGNSENGDVQL